MTFDLDHQQEYWDRVAWEKDFTIPPELAGLTRHLPPSARILDYGCGYGRVAAELSELGYDQVVGVDLSPQVIQRGLALHPGLDLRPLGGDGLPFAPGSFAAVILMGVLTCLPSDEGQVRLLAELAQVLGDDGIIYVADFLINTDERSRLRYERFAARHGQYGVFELEEGVVLRHHSLEWIERLTCGFAKLDLRLTTVPTMNGHQSRAFYLVGRKTPGLSLSE